MMMKLKLKFRVHVDDNHITKFDKEKGINVITYRAWVETKMLFNKWKRGYSFFGDNYEQLMKDVDDFIEVCKQGQHWRYKPTYTLLDAIRCQWNAFKWKWLDFGYIGKLHKYDCPQFLPLKKVWYFGYPRIKIHEATDNIKSWLKFGWFNRWLIKKTDRYIRLHTPLTESPLVPIFRNNINPLAALYIFPLGWKDKFNTPRYECPPQVSLWLFRVFNIGYQLYPDFEKYAKNIPKDDFWINVDDYWEQSLWVTEYNGGDVDKARDTWPWQSVPMKEGDIKETTWKDIYLI